MAMDPAMAIEVAAMSRQRALEEAIARGDSEIQRFYQGSTVFVTGGTGFLGKQLIEKLFRSNEITKIYVLIRQKKGKLIQERLNEMTQDPVFDIVRKMKPDFEQKLVGVAGDVAELRLGISSQDWEILSNEIDVIFHMAATTRFDECLRVATLINVRGTREAMLLAKACKQLKSFVHVSTAYTHATKSLIDKKVYEEFQPSPIAPETLISLAEKMDESRLDAITPGLVGNWPNTYTFAKTVAEDIVRTMSDGLPLCIVRPGIVVAAYREPSPGWLDMSCAYGASGVYAPTSTHLDDEVEDMYEYISKALHNTTKAHFNVVMGDFNSKLLLGAGLGVLHLNYNDTQSKLGLVPCDFVNNAIIAAGREASRSTGGNNAKIYTVSSCSRNPLLYGFVPIVIRKHKKQLCTPKAIYYEYGFETNNLMIFTFLTWFLHMIPAYFVDFVCLLLGQERRLVKIYNKVYRMTIALSYFGLYSWIFDDKNLEGLYKSLSKTDKTIFNFDITCIDWEEYIKIWCVGIRKYIVKDGLKGTESAKRKQAWLRILHYILTAIYFYCYWKVFCGLYYVFSLIL